MKSKGKLTRSSNFEILRILSMIMIIMHHYALFSGFIWEGEVTTNRLIVNFFSMFGRMGVSIFIIISGFFYDKTKLSIRKIVKLLLQVWVYSILGLIIGIICNSDKVNIINTIKSMFPIIFRMYWFISCYFLIYIFSPFLKQIVDKFSKKDLKIMITLMILIWSFLGTLLSASYTFYNEFIWLIVVYIIGAYIKKYDVNIFKNNKIRLYVIFATIILLNVLMVGIEMLATKIPLLENRERFFNDMQTPFMLLLALLLFNIFKNINMKNYELINKIASTTFGVYLIHANYFLGDIIWKNIVQGAKYVNSPMLILNAILGVIGVFIACSIIDFIVEKVIINNLIKLLSNIYYKVKQLKKYIRIKNKLIEFYNN